MRSKRKNYKLVTIVLELIARLGVSIYAAYGNDSIPCANVSSNQFFELKQFGTVAG